MVLRKNHEQLEALELIKYAYEIFKPNIIATTSFGVSSGVLIDIISKSCLPIKIVYVNTGFLFKETLDYIETIKKLYNKLEFIEISPNISKQDFLEKEGTDIMKKDPDFCCRERKIKPFYEYLQKNNIKAWISGLRKDQTEYRRKLKKIELLDSGIYKIYPILNWSSKDVHLYMEKNNIPFHPLYLKGYTSIGCEPCTELPDLNDERSGRWKGHYKKECGLHTEIK